MKGIVSFIYSIDNKVQDYSWFIFRPASEILLF